MEDGTTCQGGVNAVRRQGCRVHRPATVATPTIHRLLRHLRAAGFEAAPEPFGFDEAGNEVVSYLDGEVVDPLPAGSRTPELLWSVGALLRRFHDASASFVPDRSDVWQLPAGGPPEVICHGDIAPYNCVIRAGRVVGFIDFDLAHPGPRDSDLAYAVYRFAPLQAPDNPDSEGDLVTQARRAARICAGYGRLPDSSLLDAVVARLTALMAFMRGRAEAGDAAFQAHIQAGHLALYEADIDYLRIERDRFRRFFASSR